MPENITAYLHGIFIISLTGTIAESLLSATSKNTKTLESALKLVFSLCLLLSVTIPAANIIRNTDFSDFFNVPISLSLTQEEQNIISLTKKQLENDVSQKIYEKFGIIPHEVCIDFVTEENENHVNVNIENISIKLPDEMENQKEAVYSYANSLFGINKQTDGEQSNEK